MRCQRCAGLLVEEWLYDQSAQPAYVRAERCVNCGCVHEPMIQVNRGKVKHDDSIQA